MAKKQFKAESKRLLDLMINSIYTHQEIFLREIISNASDAIDKLAYLALTDENVGLSRSDFAIQLKPDETARTLTVSDNGIGMDKDEMENNLGTICRSGSLQFKQTLDKDKAADTDIIGQFGVGFYSAFMVADKVTVISKKYGSDEAWKWESEGADGYTMTPCERANAGTDVIMQLKADSNYQPGQIIEQDPKSGHVRKNNLKITVWICAKEETNLMVNVLGEDVQDAKVELTNLNLNLNVQIREVYSDEYAAGKVISSTPAAGESIKKGDSILLTVSKGPETKPVTVQNYAGLSVDDAALQAENAGLTVGAHQYEYDATVPEGSVIRQSLAPNTEVAPGTEIVFTVSKGPEPSQTTEQTVTFDIPGEYLNPELGILNVEIRQDTTVVYSTTVDTTDPAAARSVSHTFTGDKGTSITVYLYINGTEVASQVVSF